MSVCIVFRGEMLRDSQSSYFTDQTKKRRNYVVTDERKSKQHEIFQSICDKIIVPFKEHGFRVMVSGAVYSCPPIESSLKEYFGNHTIKMIEPGKTNACELLHISLVHARRSCQSAPIIKESQQHRKNPNNELKHAN